MKRILALLLCLALCFSMIPAAFAEDIEIIDEAEEALVSIESEEDIVIEPEEAPLIEEEPNVSTAVVYRALLIGEVSFDRETANRNKGDVQRIAEMLGKTNGPQGTPYRVTSKYDLSYSGIKSAISSTFKGADSNDVSLIFIATHGVTNLSSGYYAGALETIENPGVTTDLLPLEDLAGWLNAVPGKIIVMLGSCGSGAAIVSNGRTTIVPNDSEEADAAFTDAVIQTFAQADEDMRAPGDAEPNTGEFRNSKYYVLTAAAHQENSWGQESSDSEYCYNAFPFYVAQGGYYKPNYFYEVSGHTQGDMMADSNGDYVVTLKELYNYVYNNAYGPYTSGGQNYYQHAQVYPSNSTYPLFTGLRMSKLSMSLALKKTATLKATLATGKTPSNLTWSSTNTSVATVSSSGVVTAKKYGSAFIVAKINTSVATIGNVACICKVSTLFSDVTDSSAYYYKPVYWAADKGITNGYDDGTFGVGKACTREQMMTFLWRMKGKPEPSSTSTKFSDVKSGDYYYKAVLWGVEKGITKGYDDGTFGVRKACLREHMVTFLYRYYKL